MNDGYFETFRTYGGQPALLGAHLRRLQEAVVENGFEGAPTIAELTTEARLLAKAAGGEDLMMRVSVERDEAGMVSHRIEPGPIPPHALAGGMANASATIADVPGYAYPLKSTLRAAHSELMDQAAAAGIDETIIVDGETVIEGTRTNVFVLNGDEFATPALGRCLPGVTREALLTLAPELGLNPVEREVTVAELSDPDEVFIANALIEIRPVTSIDGESVGGRSPGVHTRLVAALLNHYRTAGG